MPVLMRLKHNKRSQNASVYKGINIIRGHWGLDIPIQSGSKQQQEVVNVANDTEMWQDVGEAEGPEATDLLACYTARYVDTRLDKAEKLKAKFERTYGYWGNWY